MRFAWLAVAAGGVESWEGSQLICWLDWHAFHGAYVLQKSIEQEPLWIIFRLARQGRGVHC